MLIAQSIYAHLGNKLQIFKQNLILQEDYFPSKRFLLNTLPFLMVAVTSESAAVVSMAQRMRAIQPF